MEWRKLLFFPDHFSSALHAKRRVVSGFGVCLLASLLVFYLLIPISYNTTDSAVATTSAHSLFSWFSSSNATASATPTSDEELQTHGTGLLLGKGGELVTEKTHYGNSSQNPVLGEGRTTDEKIVKGSLDNSSREASNPAKNGSFLGKVGVLEKTHEENLSWKGNVASSSGDGLVQGGTHAKKFSFVMNNASSPGKGGAEAKTYIALVSDEGNNTSPSSGNAKEPSMSAKTSNSSESSKSTKLQVTTAGVSGKKCDIFDGRWVRDKGKPFYPAGSCPYIDIDFNCHKNGRPDKEFLKWSWQPNGCDIPRMNATDFLERLRGKRLIFVGDSLNRNMWESLVCILRQSIKNKKRVFEMSGRSEFKTRGYYAFKFKDYNCSVDFVRTPFLVKELYANGVNGAEDEKLRLDVLDETTAAYHEAEVIVFNTGHWWTHEKTSRGIDYYQEGNYVYPVLKVMEAYEKALHTWAKWVDKYINANKTRVVFRGYSLTHFRGGQWNSGGQCHKETEPIFNETFLEKYPSKTRTLERVLKKMKTPVIYLNISRLTDYRKDGHPSIYRKKYKNVEEQIAAEKSQDCSHWCLPGVPDTWNELLYASLLMDGKGPWRN